MALGGSYQPLQFTAEEPRFREVNLLTKATQLEICMTSKPVEKGREVEGVEVKVGGIRGGTDFQAPPIHSVHTISPRPVPQNTHTHTQSHRAEHS